MLRRIRGPPLIVTTLLKKAVRIRSDTFFPCSIHSVVIIVMLIIHLVSHRREGRYKQCN